MKKNLESQLKIKYLEFMDHVIDGDEDAAVKSFNDPYNTGAGDSINQSSISDGKVDQHNIPHNELLNDDPIVLSLIKKNKKLA